MITTLAAPRSVPEDGDRDVRRQRRDQDVSRDPDRLRARDRRAEHALHARLPGGLQRGADDRRAAAGPRRAGILVTDADSLRTGPSRRASTALPSKGRGCHTLLSGSCPPEQNPPRGADRGAPPTPPRDPRREPGRGQAAGRARGRELVPHVQRGEPVLRRRVRVPARGEDGHRGRATGYSNTLANLGDLGGAPRRSRRSARRRCRRGATLDVEIDGFGHELRSREHGRGRRRGRVGAARAGALADAHPRPADGRAGRRARLPRRDRDHDAARRDGAGSARCRWSSPPALARDRVGRAARRSPPGATRTSRSRRADALRRGQRRRTSAPG